MRRSFWLATVSAIASFALIVLGGLSRTQTGPGCTDWPKCNGSWLPPVESAALIDWLHRAVSASIGLLLLVTAISVVTSACSSRSRRAAFVAVGLVVTQSAIGALTVGGVAPAWVSTIHLGLAILLFTATMLLALAIAADRGAPRWAASLLAPGTAVEPHLRHSALLAIAAIFVVILSGAAANATSVAVACTTWPLCPDNAAAGLVAPRAISTNGILIASAVSVLVVAVVAWQGLTRPVTPTTRTLAIGALGLVGLQTIADAGAIATGHALWVAPISLTVLTALLALMVVLFLAGGMAPVAVGAAAIGGTMPAPARELPTPGIVATSRNYVALTKPGIMTLLLTTTLGAMLIAEAGMPPVTLILLTLLGGVLSSGGANVLNCYIDRDIDAQMSRTKARASASGEIAPRNVLLFGTALTVIAVVQLWITVNPLAAMLALSGNLFYVFVYTLWLKRRTPQNIVIGGAAGAVPPLVGWAAVTGDLSILAWGLFAIIFLWTPPHFWALALLKQGEYGRVGVPMLPNVAGERETRKQILIYTVLLFALCVGLTPFGLGWIYLVAAILINGAFLYYAIRLWLNPSKATARGMFFYSLWYLALIYAAAVIDRVL